jgi:hypothetical protein
MDIANIYYGDMNTPGANISRNSVPISDAKHLITIRGNKFMVS